MRSLRLLRTLAVVLLLTGCTAEARKVTLNWNPSNCRDLSVLTYTVYRATFKLPPPGNPQVGVIATGIVKPTFVDTKVAKDTWYYYKVQTVCSGSGYHSESKLSEGIPVYVPKKVKKK
jgi:hypothetical protein